MSLCEIQYVQVLKEVHDMATRNSMGFCNTSCCSSSAVECTSAHIVSIMDTAIIAVSTSVILISLLRLCGLDA